MNTEATNLMNAMAPDALEKLKQYFKSADDDAAKKADAALKLLGRINGNDSNRLKGIALQFQVARQMGMKGEPLRPLLAALNPAYASGAAESKPRAALAGQADQQDAAKMAAPDGSA